MKKDLNYYLGLWIFEQKQDALDVIYNELLQEAKRVAYTYNLVFCCGEDLLQDTLIALYQKRDTIKEPLHYYRVILSNKAKSALEEEHIQRKYDDFDLNSIAAKETVESDIFVKNDHADLETLQSLSIEKCLAKLTTIQKEALTLSILEQRRNIDIARALGITPKTAAKRIADSKQAFRKNYELEI